MVNKGNAFDKPGINSLHKVEVRKHAQLLASAVRQPGIEEDTFRDGLFDLIDGSGMTEVRKSQARNEIKTMYDRQLKLGIHPLNLANQSCKACVNPHATHDVFCLGRQQKPSCKKEQALRKAMFARLRAKWAEKQYEAQTEEAPLPPAVSMQQIEDGIEQGMRAAAALHSKDWFDFDFDFTVGQVPRRAPPLAVVQ